jgi:uncharacterized SAM-binding protein YcdF (DUF218 family)
VVTVTIGFLFCIGCVVLLSMSSSHDSRNETIVFTNPQDIPPAVLKNLHSILVLGGGVPDSIDHPPVYVERRCDDAASVVQQHNKGLSKSNQDSLPILCLSAGTAHLPQLLSADGLPIWESTACAAYLDKNHGLSKNVYVETTSYDTIGNAFYARTSHTDVNGWRNLLVVTNEFHMERTKAIFDWIFLRCDTDGGASRRQPKYKLYYLSSPNVGLSERALQARKEREAQSEQTVREKLVPRYKRLKDVWGFLNHHHSFYTASKLVDRARGKGDATASEMVKQSYGAGSNNSNRKE